MIVRYISVHLLLLLLLMSPLQLNLHWICIASNAGLPTDWSADQRGQWMLLTIGRQCSRPVLLTAEQQQQPVFRVQYKQWMSWSWTLASLLLWPPVAWCLGTLAALKLSRLHRWNSLSWTNSDLLQCQVGIPFHSIYLKISPQATIDTHSKQHIKTQKHTHKRNTHKRNKM